MLSEKQTYKQQSAFYWNAPRVRSAPLSAFTTKPLLFPCPRTTYIAESRISQHFLLSFVCLANFIYCWPSMGRSNTHSQRRERVRVRSTQQKEKQQFKHWRLNAWALEQLQVHSIHLRTKKKNTETELELALYHIPDNKLFEKSFFVCKQSEMGWIAIGMCGAHIVYVVLSHSFIVVGTWQPTRSYPHTDYALFIRFYLIFNIFELDLIFRQQKLKPCVCVWTEEHLP